ncbi:MAG: NAD-dependent protein deacetylase [Rhodothermaceae bacterium]|nr:MAG: NAD-dependent protein deacetylase [Rhodothermaceae bacterium]
MDLPCDKGAFRALVGLLHGRRTVVLSGAGCSTESGIPDYRGPETRRRARRPMPFQAFAGDPEARRRYWARSAAGWQRVALARPNAAHRALARMEHGGHVCGVITQNVDGLHTAAGSRRVVELHGTLARVRCLDCGTTEARAAFQQRLLARNPAWRPEHVRVAPDGDAEVDEAAVRSFVVPGCAACGGVLRPDVVFFGESVPRERVEAAWQLFEEAEVLLVVGSSLAVYSGYRFVLRAAREGRPVALINLGPTRGDALAAVRVAGRLGEVLPRLAAALEGGCGA